MSDPTDLANVAITGGAAITSSGLIGILMRAALGKQSVDVATKLAVIEEQLKTLVAASLKHDVLADRLTKLEALCANCPRRPKR